MIRPASLAVLLTMIAAGAAAAQAPADPAFGVWRNAKDSVHVEIKPCGAQACGTVIWASPKAEADARRGGTKELLGLQIFRNMVRDKAGGWRGKVYAPDLNMTFAGTAVAEGEVLHARGCVLSVICKSLTWTRIEGAS